MVPVGFDLKFYTGNVHDLVIGFMTCGLYLEDSEDSEMTSEDLSGVDSRLDIKLTFLT